MLDRTQFGLDFKAIALALLGIEQLVEIARAANGRQLLVLDLIIEG